MGKLNRRDFLKISSIVGLGSALMPLEVLAGDLNHIESEFFGLFKSWLKNNNENQMPLYFEKYLYEVRLGALDIGRAYLARRKENNNGDELSYRVGSVSLDFHDPSRDNCSYEVGSRDVVEMQESFFKTGEEKKTIFERRTEKGCVNIVYKNGEVDFLKYFFNMIEQIREEGIESLDQKVQKISLGARDGRTAYIKTERLKKEDKKDKHLGRLNCIRIYSSDPHGNTLPVDIAWVFKIKNFDIWFSEKDAIPAKVRVVTNLRFIKMYAELIRREEWEKEQY